MSIKIDRKVRTQKMLKATPLEKRMIMMRDIARCRSPIRAYLWVTEGLLIWLENKSLTSEDKKAIEIELKRVQTMTAEELYEELKIVP